MTALNERPYDDVMWAMEMEARADERARWLQDHGWTCRGCGHKWDPEDGAQEACPVCGGPPVE